MKGRLINKILTKLSYFIYCVESSDKIIAKTPMQNIINLYFS